MNTIDELKEIGNGFFDSGKYHKAIEYFTKAIDLNADDADAYDLRGVTWCRLLEFDKGATDLNKALSIDPEFHLALSHLGEIALYKNDFHTAEKYYEKALEILADNTNYLSNLALVKKHLKKNNESFELCQAILKNYPEDKWARHLRAELFLDKKMYADAIEDYKRLISGDMRNAGLYNNVGYAYSKIGIIDKAKSNLLFCLSLNAGHAYAHNNLGYVYYLEDNYKKAIEYINKSLELDASNSYAYKNRALVFIIQEQYSKAITDLNKALELGYSNDYGSEVEELLEGVKLMNK